MEIPTVTAILIASAMLLITEWIPIDLTAIGIMCTLAVTGILNPVETAAGFGNPAVITVGAMFLLSRAMVRTGVVGSIVRRIMEYSGKSPRLAILAVLLMVGFASAFINNTPVVVLFIPIILALSCEYGFSPSKFLIPVSYASILAGTCTLIGTSTNIIVSDLSFMYGYGELGMFELAKLGVPIAILGFFFLYLAAPRLLPGHAAPVCEVEDREDRLYLTELLVAEGSPLIGKPAERLFADRYPSAELYEVIREFHIFYPERDPVRIAEKDLLFVKASANDLISMLQDRIVELPYAAEGLSFATGEKRALIVELIVPPQSSLLGEKLLNTQLLRRPDLHVIAIKRRRVLYSEQRIRNVRLRVGDILLVHCPEDTLSEIRQGIDFIIVEDVHHRIVHRRKSGRAILIFLGVITAASTGVADIMVCALAGAFLMIIGGCIQLRDAYRAIRGDVLLLIAGTIALGSAMEKTGASRLYAEGFLSLSHGLGPQIVLGGMILLTSLSTQLLSNNATAVLILPVAVSTAMGLGVSPKPFIIGVCFGASACFATPIGYQTNLLVYGPGGYRFTDYLKLGIPLNLLVLAMGSFFIPHLWPF